MDSYTAEYPNLDIDPDIKRFFETFYGLSDRPGAHEEYTNSFTEDATLIMGSKSARGRNGRKGKPATC
jgi:hypothetical protein